MKIKEFSYRPLFMKMWEDYPKLWKLLIDMGTFMKYKTLNVDKLPEKVTFPSSTMIYINSNENRGRALLVKEGITQKRLYHFWNKLVKEYSPDLIIDVGVNYGECIFSTVYPIHSEIYGIEANHSLLKYISKSKEVHPNQSQISIIHALASDQNAVEKDFYIDQNWSGTSSASYVPSHNMVERVPVQTVTIDALIKEKASYNTFLFKVDVEGYEAFVLKGMEDLLANCESAIGFLEFNSDYIDKSGISSDQFFNYLQRHFSIYMYREDDTLTCADHLKLSHLQELFRSTYIHTDFVLVGGNMPLNVEELFAP
ncbi:FkbM family methyltransferase [Salinibacillus xinjiangensis]|uniref:FkbM family methyltransferase n=1 Tax=Salinibacillus xinjiangensis TaxID=1229268 RepID=A0A6G1X972_9BACI|nr:FkbM family methyltransferase [Salinibacillus xinjiangensis]MRG87420.1 FkbM family methyltransferase [Salinibacillus xinjiangensis]